MEQHYMSLIWEVIALKENEQLTTAEKQAKIVEILSTMKKDVEGLTRYQFKRQCLKVVEEALFSTPIL